MLQHYLKHYILGSGVREFYESGIENLEIIDLLVLQHQKTQVVSHLNINESYLFLLYKALFTLYLLSTCNEFLRLKRVYFTHKPSLRNNTDYYKGSAKANPSYFAPNNCLHSATTGITIDNNTRGNLRYNDNGCFERYCISRTWLTFYNRKVVTFKLCKTIDL